MVSVSPVRVIVRVGGISEMRAGWRAAMPHAGRHHLPFRARRVQSRTPN